MRRIRSLRLENYRIFNEMAQFNLAPITIMTGVNSSGKSSVVKSLHLLRNIDTKTTPYQIRFDSNPSHYSSFDLVKNHHSKKGKLHLGYTLRNDFLGQNVTVSFQIERKNEFEGSVNEIQFEAEGKIILCLKFEDDDKTAVYANLEFFWDNLREFISLKEKYKKFSDLIKDDETIPSSYVLKYYSSPWIYDEDDGNFRQMTDKEVSDASEKEKILRDELKALQGKKTLTISEKKWLKDFFESDLHFDNERSLEDQWHKIVESVKSNEKLFNHELLGQILELQKGDLNNINIKKLINEIIPELEQLVAKDKLDEAITDLKDTLLIKKYSEKETEFLHENESLVNINWISEMSADKIEFCIQEYGKIVFAKDPFYQLFDVDSIKAEGKRLFVDWKGFQKTPENLSKLMGYIFLFFRKTEADLFTDINSISHISLASLTVSRLLDFSHPLHKLIANNKEKIEKSAFVKKWLKEFEVCDDFSIATPVSGLGYSIKLVKKGKKIQLFDEGMGTIHLISILFNIAVYDLGNGFKGENTLILEEPEANMHPAWQSKLADLFLDASQNLGVHFIIETHSEYIIRKLQNLVAKKKANGKGIIIHYIGNKDTKSQKTDIRSISINANGTLSEEFGPGFFDEADNLAFELMKFRHINNN